MVKALDAGKQQSEETQPHSTAEVGRPKDHLKLAVPDRSRSASPSPTDHGPSLVSSAPVSPGRMERLLGHFRKESGESIEAGSSRSSSRSRAFLGVGTDTPTPDRISRSRSPWERIKQTYSDENTTLEGFQWAGDNGLGQCSLREQDKKLEKIVKQVEAHRPQSDIRLAMRRHIKASNQVEQPLRQPLPEAISPDEFIRNRLENLHLSNKPRTEDAARKRDSSTADRDASASGNVSDHIITSVKKIGGSWWDVATELVKNVSQGEGDAKTSRLKTLSLELVALRSPKQTFTANLKEWESVANENAARQIEYIRKFHHIISRMRTGFHDLGLGGNAVASAASNEIAGMKVELDKLEAPEMLLFELKPNSMQESFSLDQILSEASVKRSDTMNTGLSQDSVQEAINDTLGAVNVSAMRDSIAQNMKELKNGEAHDAKLLARVTARLSELVNEPIAHLKILRQLPPYDKLTEFRERAQKSATERRQQMDIKETGRNIVFKEFDYLWEHDHDLKRNIERKLSDIEKETNKAEKLIESGKNFSRDKLRQHIISHAKYTDVFLNKLQERLNNIQRFYFNELKEQIELVRVDLRHEEFKANMQPANVAVEVGGGTVRTVFGKAVDTAFGMAGVPKSS